jgi:hypothetical protein
MALRDAGTNQQAGRQDIMPEPDLGDIDTFKAARQNSCKWLKTRQISHHNGACATLRLGTWRGSHDSRRRHFGTFEVLNACGRFRPNQRTRWKLGRERLVLGDIAWRSSCAVRIYWRGE